MPSQSQPNTPPYDPLIPDLSGVSYYDPYLLPQPLLPPLDLRSIFTPQVDLNYLKYYTNLMTSPPAASDSPCSHVDYTSYCLNMARSQAGVGSSLATSPPAVVEHSACPSSPAPTPVNTLDSELSPKQNLKSDIPSDLPLIPENIAIAVSPTSSSTVVPKSSRAPKRPLDDDIDSNEPALLDEDPASRKRRQNTIAARKSRLRKMIRMEELERTVADLEKDKIQLETRLAVLESEKQGAIQRADDAAARIRSLEAQLLEAYKSQRN